MARLAYLSAKEIYLSQLTDQVELLSKLTASQLDLRFLDFIEPDSDSPGVAHYCTQLKQTTKRLHLDDVFIFNSKGKIIIKATRQSAAHAGLMVHLKQIRALEIHQSHHSLPFKAKDGQWYFWNYLRLNTNYFLGVRESTHRLAELDKLAKLFWGIGLLGMILILLAGWFLGRFISRPIDKLVHFSRQIGSGNFRAQLAQNIPGELGILQQALTRMRDDLSKHEQEKENMLAQIAHELRNPLGGIALLAGLIKEDPAVNDANKTYAQRIADETEGLKNQISAYLNYSRPMQAHLESINLKLFFREMSQIVTKRNNLQKMKFQFDIQTEIMKFDPVHLKQILWNLVENSLHACEQEGQITISVKQQSIHVSDNGPGIPSANLKKVFDPFFTTSTDGTGLGLAICHKLCRENNADLTVMNNKNSGCTFTIRKL